METRGIKNVELCKPHNCDNPCSYQSFNFDLELRGMRYISRRRSGRKRRFRGDIGHYVHGYPYFPVQAERRVQYRDRLKGLYVVARNFFLLLLNFSAWLLLNKICKSLFRALYSNGAAPSVHPHSFALQQWQFIATSPIMALLLAHSLSFPQNSPFVSSIH